MSDQPKPAFDMEQFMQMQKMMQMMQPPAPAAPVGAVTGQGIRNWWPIITVIGGALISLCIWLVGASSNGTKEYTTMVNTIERHEQMLKDKADKRDLESVEKSVKGLTDEKVDKKDFQVMASKVDTMDSKLDKLASITGLLNNSMSQIMSDIRNLTPKGRQ